MQKRNGERNTAAWNICNKIIEEFTRMQTLRRNKVADNDNEIIENETMSMRFVGLLISLGIIPIFKTKKGKFTFKIFSWKTLVYLLLSIGHLIFLQYTYCLIFNLKMMDFSTKKNFDLINLKFTSPRDEFTTIVTYILMFVEILFPMLLCHGLGKGSGLSMILFQETKDLEFLEL